MIYARALTINPTSLDGAVATLHVLAPSYVFDRAHTTTADFDSGDVMATGSATITVIVGDDVQVRVTDDEFDGIDLGGDTAVGSYAVSVYGDLLRHWSITEVEGLPSDPLTFTVADGILAWEEA